MNPNDLTAFYNKTHTKEELASLLAIAVLTGSPPVEPPEWLVTSASTDRPGPGRPPAEEVELKVYAAREFIMRTFPVAASLRELAAYSGLAYQTAAKLQSDTEFLEALPLVVRTYFRSFTPTLTRRALPPAWRGLLDLHNYMLTLQQEQAQLRLWEMHASMWGESALRIYKNKQLPSYNTAERARLHSPSFLRALGDRTTVEFQETSQYLEDQCPIVTAYVGGVVLDTDSDAHGLLVKACPEQCHLLKTPRHLRFDLTKVTSVWEALL